MNTYGIVTDIFECIRKRYLSANILVLSVTFRYGQTSSDSADLLGTVNITRTGTDTTDKIGWTDTEALSPASAAYVSASVT